MNSVELVNLLYAGFDLYKNSERGMGQKQCKLVQEGPMMYLFIMYWCFIMYWILAKFYNVTLGSPSRNMLEPA